MHNTIQNNDKKKSKIAIYSLIFCIIICIVIIIIQDLSGSSTIENNLTENNVSEKDNRSELAKLLEDISVLSGIYKTYRKPNYYFPYKDKLYFYDCEEKSLYVMNMDYTNKKLISSSEEMDYPSFYLVYKDEAYFFNIEAYHNEIKKLNKKINLITGEVKNLNNDFNFLPITFDNGTIFSMGDLNISDSSTVRKYDLNTGYIYYENNYKYDALHKYIFDYKNGDYYSIKEDNINYKLFKNGVVLGEFNANKLFNDKKLIFINESYLFFVADSELYKYDIKEKTLNKKEIEDLGVFEVIQSNNLNDSYIYNKKDGYIYMLDKNNIGLNKLFVVTNNKNEDQESINSYMYDNKIYDTGSKLILLVNANTLKYSGQNDNLGSVIIYDKQINETKKIMNIRRAFFDYENKLLYIFIKETNTYKIEKISLA